MAFSNPIAAQVAAKQALPRRLYIKHLDSGDVCYTDHTQDIIFQGRTFHSRRGAHSPINTYLGKQADSTTITLDDVDGELTDYNEYEDFQGRRCEVWQVYLSYSSAIC